MNDDIEIYKIRFKERLQKNGDCLYYSGCVNKKGYGQFANPYGSLAHRFAWIIENGPISKGLMVLHRCDFPPCCNPLHLFLGTAKDNTQDMISKGRIQDYKNLPKGEKNPTSKITEEQAQKIASLITEGYYIYQIAEKLNISKNIVADIRCRKTWKHLEFIPPIKPIYKRQCLRCAKEFRIRPFEFEKTKYCSYKCYWQSLEKEKDLIICQGCGKEQLFLSRKGEIRKYCNLQCRFEYMKGKYPENIMNGLKKKN